MGGAIHLLINREDADGNWIYSTACRAYSGHGIMGKQITAHDHLVTCKQCLRARRNEGTERRAILAKQESDNAA